MKEWNCGEMSPGNIPPDAGETTCGEALTPEFKKARDKALYYLRFSPKTEDEIRRKLAEQGFSPASVSYAVGFLKRYRYLDDEDYVRRYLERMGRRKSGRQLRYELQQKGIDGETIDRVFEETPVDETETILSLMEKKHYPGAEASREERTKIMAFLSRKGFSADAVSRALRRYSEDP